MSLSDSNTPKLFLVDRHHIYYHLKHAQTLETSKIPTRAIYMHFIPRNRLGQTCLILWNRNWGEITSFYFIGRGSWTHKDSIPGKKKLKKNYIVQLRLYCTYCNLLPFSYSNQHKIIPMVIKISRIKIEREKITFHNFKLLRLFRTKRGEK